MPRRPRISLCLIARDEEQMLAECLASVAGAVDELVVVDTGSTDRTRDVARAAGARVFDLPWRDDFSAPRNEAARRARGDWILQLDADERLAPGGAAALREAVSKARYDVGMLELHDASRLDATAREVLSGAARLGAVQRVPRLLRNAGDLAYTGIVHESVTQWLARRGGRHTPVGARLIHLGAVPEVRDALRKRERNVGLLRRRCAEHPEDAVAFGYLAGELMDSGDLEAAWEAAEAGWRAVPSQPAWVAITRLAVARAALALRRGDVATALATLAQAQARQGRHVDLAYLRGCALELASLQRSGEPSRAAAEDAVAAFDEAVTCLSAPSERYAVGATTSALHVRRGDLSLAVGDPERAAAAYEAALAEDPSSVDARLGAAETLLDRGQAALGLRALEPLLAAPLAARADPWLLAADAALSLGAADDARLLWRRARERLPRGLAVSHRRRRLPRLSAVLD